jgi:hypothetical protein
MANVLDDLATHIAANTSFVVDTSLFKGSFPDTPDTCITLVEIIGDEPIETMSPSLGGFRIERPTIQVVSRAGSNDYKTARDNAETVYKKVHNIVETDLSGTRYHLVEALQPPYNIDRDKNGRWWVGFNCNVMKAPNA